MTTHSPIDRTVAMIGGGQMALALAEGFCRAGLLAPADITVYDPHAPARERLEARLPGIVFADSARAAATAASVVFLAVKPQQAQSACHEIAGHLRPNAVLVSIVAGLPAGSLALGAVGHVHEADESQMNAVTGLSGSGPGFVALLVEALADGGVKAGLPRPLALALAVQTLSGTAALLEQTGEHPAQIKDRVSSPGGTTIAGLAVLEQRGVRGALIDAVVAAATRAKELGG